MIWLTQVDNKRILILLSLVESKEKCVTEMIYLKQKKKTFFFDCFSFIGRVLRIQTH